MLPGMISPSLWRSCEHSTNQYHLEMLVLKLPYIYAKIRITTTLWQMGVFQFCFCFLLHAIFLEIYPPIQISHMHFYAYILLKNVE